MDAEHFVGKYGADIVRLWVSSVDFTDEVPFSEEMFTRLADTYRRVRNTLRILLANLHDRGGAPGAEGMRPVDRWVMSRLQGLIGACRQAYGSYEFHKVYHALNQFCAVDLSSLYVDITKDRMYCDAAGSPARRGAQEVMAAAFDALVRLAAPVLVFTADEAWEFGGNAGSVHEALFPEVDARWVDPALEAEMGRWLEVRSAIAVAVEAARKEKRIGSALEATVVLGLKDAGEAARWSGRIAELEELFILSELKIEAAAEDRVGIEPNPHRKCARCWRQRPEVGARQDHPDLCGRCAEVVAGP
jgi:isoleucyl-tRNA synthetase